MDTITLLTYEQWEEQRRNVRRKVRLKLKKERKYFRRQKLFGLSVVLLGLGIMLAGEEMLWNSFVTLGIIVSVSGMYVCITQKHLIV